MATVLKAAVKFGPKEILVDLDTAKPLHIIVHELCLKFNLTISLEHATQTYALVRNVGQALVYLTELKGLKQGEMLELRSSPQAVETDAANFVERLKGVMNFNDTSESQQFIKAIYEMKPHLKDPKFGEFFVKRNGLEILTTRLEHFHGSSRANLMAAIHDLMIHFPERWDSLPSEVIKKICLMLDAQSPINIQREALRLIS
eukprot:Colp12_sorted_trinity150504_noHs@18116